MIEKKNIQLQEVSLIRPFLIILLVFFHAFIIYDGGWYPVNGYKDIVVYKWADRLSYFFMLETFVFISGYLLSFQVFNQGREINMGKLLKKKLLRLLVPCWTFGILYISLFGEKGSLMSNIIEIISGTGHLWFLPMLFWCFVGGGYFLKKSIVYAKLLPIILIFALISYNPLPLRLNSAMYYFLFFYLGIVLYKMKDLICNKIDITFNKLILFWFIFAGLFVGGQVIRENLLTFKAESEGLILHISAQMCVNLVTIVYSLIGVLCVWFTSLWFIGKFTVSSRLVKIGESCFAIYIFQQFILMYLYYNTSLPVFLGAYWLPIIGFVFTLLFSYTLASVTRSL